MTEGEWLECEDAYPMVDLIQGALSERKFRLFGAACCRELWPLLADHRSREAITIAEKYADGHASEEEFSAARDAACQVDNGRLDASYYAAQAAARLGWTATDGYDTDYHVKLLWYDVAFTLGTEGEASSLVASLRDITGSPFRPVIINPTWRTPIVISLAEAAYENRRLPSGTLDRDCLAVLSDALEEAGCDDADILNHLRGPGPHVRGCWVVDLLTGRS